MTIQTMWQTKVLCWVRQDMETFKALRARIEPEMTKCPDKSTMEETLKCAVQWAQAADRVSLPKSIPLPKDALPEIVHPLTGETIALDLLIGSPKGTSDQTPPPGSGEASQASFSDPSAASKFPNKKPALESLLVKTDQGIDWEKSFLQIWRFAPEAPPVGLASWWKQYPVDLRSPDHTIWESLTLTSAFAGAMAADPEGLPALLLMSFGPVQGFIAQARSVSDLWAGSHFISRVAWEALRVICDAFGPDAVLFPNLHGVAQTDLWLHQKLNGQWPKSHPASWMDDPTDANPLFIATLPNRFVALLPEKGANEIIQTIESKLRVWVIKQAEEAFRCILNEAGLKHKELGDVNRQIQSQLKDFPEIHWALVPWRLATDGTNLKDDVMKELMDFIGSDADNSKVDLRNLISIHGEPFYDPNPGIFYPQLFESLERLTAAAKSCRPFSGNSSEGYRCTLCGEWEWLTPDRGNPKKPSGIFAPAGQREERSPWSEASKRSPSLVKEKEFLCARCTLKRVWPRLVVKEVEKNVSGFDTVHRYIVSTHAMALSTSLMRHILQENLQSLRNMDQVQRILKKKGEAVTFLQERISSCTDLYGAALPSMLYRRLKVAHSKEQDVEFYRKIPSLLDTLETDQDRDAVITRLTDLLGVSPETYYALILMDGDKMGAWLAGDMHADLLETRFHSSLRQSLAEIQELKAYRTARRSVSPGYHQAISTALNSFALYLARTVVEEMFMGKLIFAGGEDILAMVAVHDLPAVMTTLRCAFSGMLPQEVDPKEFWKAMDTEADRIELKRGFVILREGTEKRILRMMGKYATASIGAVIAHHRVPLGRVIAALHSAENRAKNDGGRDAFCITVMKRSGGIHHFVGKWGLEIPWSKSDMGLLFELRKVFAKDISRRTAYILEDVLLHLPVGALAGVLRYQFGRQFKEPDTKLGDLPERLAEAARKRDGADTTGRTGHAWLHTLMLISEFLAREGRLMS